MANSSQSDPAARKKNGKAVPAKKKGARAEKPPPNIRRPGDPLPKLIMRWTKRGSWCARFALLFLVLGAVTRNETLCVLALLFLLLLPLSFFLTRLNLSRIDYTCVVPSRPFAQQPFTARLQLRSHARLLPRFTIAVEDPLLTTLSAHWLLPVIRPGEEVEKRRESRMLRRGRINASPVVIRTTFPFGFFEARRVWQVDPGIVVYPAPLTPETQRNRSEDRQRDPMSALFAPPIDAGEFRSVREFRSGDRLRSVHWPASLRHDKLVVRQFDPPLVDAFSFVFHTYSPKGEMQKPKSFDRCMQLLCGFFLQCKEAGLPFDFTASFNKYQTVEVRDPRDIDHVLELVACAIERPERDPHRFVDRVRRRAETRRCFVVSNIPVSQWAHLLDELPMDIDCVDAQTWRSATERNLAKVANVAKAVPQGPPLSSRLPPPRRRA